MSFSASFYFTRPILIRHNIYTIIFKFNLIKSRVMVGLGFYSWYQGFLLMNFTGFIIIVIIQSSFIGMDWSRILQSSQCHERQSQFSRCM